ncbi:DUF3021 domain-containing protein [Streptococcus dentasini]
MKRFLRKMALYALIGVGFGGFTYVVILWLNGAESQSVEQIANVVWISALIGLISMIFSFERPSFIAQLFLHFCLVYSLVILMNRLNDYDGTLFSLSSFGNFILCYLIIWGIVYSIWLHRIDKINHKLAEKKKSKS